jgi:transposase
MVAADARTAIAFALSPGNDHDAPHGRALLEELGPMPEGLPLLMDRAYEGNETRQLVLDLGMVPVVPPKSNRLHPWEYDRALYKKRNEIERLFRRLKGFRRIFSRFEKLDVVFLAFLCVLPATLRQLGFLLGQEAADRGSAYFELAGDLGFADTFAV